MLCNFVDINKYFVGKFCLHVHDTSLFKDESGGLPCNASSFLATYSVSHHRTPHSWHSSWES